MNPEEVIAHEKLLQDLTEKAMKRFMKGLDADLDDQPLPEVVPTLVRKFKSAIKEVYEPVKLSNQEGMLECIEDPKGNCIWD